MAEAVPSPAVDPGRVTRHVTLCLLLTLVVLVVFADTVASIVSIWIRSETYAHGFFVVPASLWLMWRSRYIFTRITPVADHRALPVLAALGFAWLLGRITDALIVQHLALVLMLPTIAWAILGWAVVRAWAFPLTFLIFAVPMGEALVPVLIDYTGDFTVMAIKLTGVPVYREGNLISLPTGDWSVVSACSGIRYLIASVTVGFVYAYLTYHSTWRRLAFIALSVAVPIVANWLRAYMIVMIGHYSDMTLAVGVDHIIYGWLFFGVVMLILFWLGSLWREDHEPPPLPKANRVGRIGASRHAWVAAAALLCLAVWPAWAKHIAAQPALTELPERYQALPDIPGWQRQDGAITPWKALFKGQYEVQRQVYTRDGQAVELRVFYYTTQSQGEELVSSANVLVRELDPYWHQVASRSMPLPVAGLDSARMYKLKGVQQSLFISQWYLVDGQYTPSPYLAKWWQARARLLGRSELAANLLVLTETAERDDVALERNTRFIEALLAPGTDLWQGSP